MDDLISRSALIKILKEWADTNAMRGYDTAYDVVQDCISTVENQPTAYDKEKVVAELEQQAEQYRNRGFEHEQKGFSAMADKYYGKQCSYLHAIDIVRKGGVE